MEEVDDLIEDLSTANIFLSKVYGIRLIDVFEDRKIKKMVNIYILYYYYKFIIFLIIYMILTISGFLTIICLSLICLF